MDNGSPPQAVPEADKDFEQFVCAACHNLRERLRNLRLQAELAAASDRPNDCQIEDQIRAMESILDGMVEYALAGVSQGQHSRVDLNDVLKRVLLPLDKHAVTQDPLPVVMGDPEQLARVFRHLLENAIKFNGDAAPQIHVSAKRGGPEWVLSIRDNGPGIEAAYQERAFTPFKRLHGRSYPGNGLGLAICRKLIAKHGGKIWMESAPNGSSGTTVLFCLPAAAPAD
jgi:signal transduction histidine kinase